MSNRLKTRNRSRIGLLGAMSMATMLIAFSMSGCARKDTGSLPAIDGALLDAGHTRVYGIMQNGTRVVEAQFTATKTADGSGWTFHNVSIVGGAAVQDTTVSANSAFVPTRTVTDLKTANGDYHIDTTYEGTKVTIKADTPNGPQTIDREAKAPFIDNDQVLDVVGAMALKDGFKASFNLVVPNSASMVSTGVEVTGTEQVKVAFGEFAAYKVTLKFDTVTQTAWYAVDGHRLLKYDNGTTTMELEQVNPIAG